MSRIDSVLRALIVALIVLAAPVAVDAQGPSSPAAEPPPIPTPAEFSEEARRAYASGLRQARESIEAKRFDEALRGLDALIGERPREPQARFLRAVVLADSGRGEEAIAALRELVADYPELPEPHNNLAVLYAGKGEYELARAELALALASEPDYAIAHENMGDVHVRLAATHYQRAGEIDRANKSAEAKLRLAREIVAQDVAAKR
jgi:tetratricopeptide (TPR) repeat protein